MCSRPELKVLIVKEKFILMGNWTQILTSKSLAQIRLRVTVPTIFQTILPKSKAFCTEYFGFILVWAATKYSGVQHLTQESKLP